MVEGDVRFSRSLVGTRAMRAPLSWLREYAALPDGPRPAARWPRRWSAPGSRWRRSSRPVPTSPGRWWSAGCWRSTTSRRRTARPSAGAGSTSASTTRRRAGSRGIVCGAHNFAVGDLVVVALPGAVLPGGFAIAARKTYGHVSDGMICSARRARPGRRPRRDHGARPTPDLAPGADAAAGAARCATTCSTSPSPPTAATACPSAVWPARRRRRSASRSPTRSTGRCRRPGRRRLPGRAGVAGLPAVRRASRVTGIDPTRPSPRWLARRVQLAGMRSISLAVDITNYVMLETGQPIHAYDARPAARPDRRPRRPRPGERLTTLDDVVRDLRPGDLLITDDSGPIGLAGVMGGASTELSPATTDGGDRGGALRRDDDRPDLAPAQAVLGGVAAVRAGRRPRRRVRRRAPGRASCWSSWPAARWSAAETVRRRGAGRRRRTTIAAALPGRDPRHAGRPRPRWSS